MKDAAVQAIGGSCGTQNRYRTSYEARSPGGDVGKEGDEVFVPLRLLYAGSSAGRRERERERRIAGHLERRREHGARPAPRARGLSQADIVQAAVAIADAEGTSAVSIRRIARDLGVGPMSLYWYVVSTEELHQLMLERVQGEIAAVEPSGDWRTDLRGYAHSSRAALRRHPWAIDFLGIGPPSGPNEARGAELLIAALDGTGLDLTTVMWAVMAVVTYVMGAALREIQEARWQRAVGEIKASMTEAEVAERLSEFSRRFRDSGEYPHLTRLMDAGIDPDSLDTQEDRFEFGLTCVLDGIAARIGND